MRTMLHCSLPKVVPPRFAQRFPQLADVGGRIASFHLDNALENQARAVEDAVGDTFGEVHWARPDEPTDKAGIERFHQTIQNYVASELESHTLDPRTVRELGLDPRTKAAITTQSLDVLIGEAVATWMLQASPERLSGRCQPEAFVQAAARDGIDRPEDLDQLEAAMGDVEYDVTFDRTGFKIEGLRYGCAQLTPELLAEELAMERGRGGAALKGYVKRKVRYMPDDLGHASVWSEHRQCYVRFRCTRPDYATGLPMWLHLRLRDYASATDVPFITEREQIKARAGFVHLVRALTDAAGDAARRLQYRLLSLPSMHAVFGDDAELVRCPPTRSGEFPTIPHEFAAGERLDGHRPQPRPFRRGGGSAPVDENGVPSAGIGDQDGGAGALDDGDDPDAEGGGHAAPPRAPRLERVPTSTSGSGGRTRNPAGATGEAARRPPSRTDWDDDYR